MVIFCSMAASLLLHPSDVAPEWHRHWLLLFQGPPTAVTCTPHCTPPCLAASSGKSSWTVSPREALATGMVLTLAKGRGSFPDGCLP